MITNEEDVNESFCKQLPKVELHAHLNGSISDLCLLDLLEKKDITNFQTASTVIRKGDQRSMEECFDIFNILHELVDDVDSLRVVTECVLNEFMNDNVVYLELRSTPRANPKTNLTKQLYVETILDCIKRHNYEHKDKMVVRFLPSVDRSKSVAEAWENVKLAEEYFNSSDSLVPGIDLSGNPYSNTNNGANIIPPLLYAKNAGLKLAVHMAEIGEKELEWKNFLELPPDRIGHGTFIKCNQELSSFVKEKKIPLEICVTSNIKTKTSPPNVKDHHVGWWTNNFSEPSHPCILCTDDMGIFSTSLSHEYYCVASAFNLSKNELFTLSLNSANYIFADESTKKDLKTNMTLRYESL